MKTLYESAFAKLNLYLDVLDLRKDGYHNIQSVMQEITLRDDMEIQLGTGEAWVVDSDREEVPCNEHNLCWKAAEAFFKRIGEDPDGLTVHILKRIPMGAGLGGGSSDAAALLRALDVAYGNPLSLDELCQVGAKVGSDVPFCILGGTAIAQSRGELLMPLTHVPHYYYVVVKPEFDCATGNLYEELDKTVREQAPGMDRMVNAIRNQNVRLTAANFYNCFEKLVARREPEINKIKQQLKQYGAINAQMTGSGSAVFGLFESFEEAAEACATLFEKYPQTFLASNSIDRE